MKTENIFFYGICGLLSTTAAQAIEKQKEVADHKSLPNVVLILADDGERYDVKAEFPEVVAELEKIATEARNDLGDRLKNIKGAGVREPGRARVIDSCRDVACNVSTIMHLQSISRPSTV